MSKRRLRRDYRSYLKGVLLLITFIALPVIAWAQWTTSSNDIYNSNSGNVGIGTSSPTRKLHIVGQDVGVRLVNSGTGHSWSLVADTVSSNDDKFSIYDESAGARLLIDTNGNVGIGTTGPTRQLQVLGAGQAVWNGLTDAGNKGGTLYVQDSNGAPYNGGAIIFGAVQGYFAGIKSLITDGGGNTVGRLDFQTRGSTSDSALTSRLYITETGNIGVGTISPSSKLDVAGDITVSGNISAKYQDIAEWVSTTQNLPAGTVVALDITSDNGIVPSSIPYDTHVAGVVSDSPGIILGQAGPGKLKIATTGRVKVHVDTSNGPIRRGDLLVTGTREGTAVRSEAIDLGGAKFHRPGTLIGKALEPLETGEGEILVLLSLQ